MILKSTGKEPGQNDRCRTCKNWRLDKTAIGEEAGTRFGVCLIGTLPFPLKTVEGNICEDFQPRFEPGGIVATGGDPYGLPDWLGVIDDLSTTAGDSLEDYPNQKKPYLLKGVRTDCEQPAPDSRIFITRTSGKIRVGIAPRHSVGVFSFFLPDLHFFLAW